MSIKDLVPWKREKRGLAETSGKGSPILSLHREMDRVFDDFFQGFESGPLAGYGGLNGLTPRIDLTENRDQVLISAEIPGMDEKDLDISLGQGAVTIKGEKREEHEKKDNEYYRMERSYGSFHRTIPIPAEVEEDKVEATYTKGVLTIKLSKTAEARKQPKRIAVRTG